jgi:malic enzyme
LAYKTSATSIFQKVAIRAGNSIAELASGAEKMARETVWPGVFNPTIAVGTAITDRALAKQTCTKSFKDQRLGFSGGPFTLRHGRIRQSPSSG